MLLPSASSRSPAASTARTSYTTGVSTMPLGGSHDPCQSTVALDDYLFDRCWTETAARHLDKKAPSSKITNRKEPVMQSLTIVAKAFSRSGAATVRPCG
jgi:hypothetical protein